MICGGEFKECRTCKEILPLTAFTKRARYADGLERVCRECKRAYAAGYKDYQKAWREANREHLRAYKHEQYEANKERHNEKTRAWQEKNREKVREIVKRSKAKSPEKELERQRRYREAHPGYAVRNKHRRRARMANVVNNLTPEQWEARIDYFGRRCAYCNRHLSTVTVDHITPIYRGGAHTEENVVPACHTCNVRKSTRSLISILWRPITEAA